MAYTTIDKPSDYFNTKLYTGTGSEHAISGIGFAPNLVWLKCRSDANNPMLFDTVRGATKNLYPNLTTAEGTEAQSLKSFDSDGYTLGTESDINGSSKTNVGWNWKAGGSASSNSNGSITSSVSANQDAGFSIVSYTGNSSNSQTVGHGLGVAPSMVIIKNRVRSDEGWWTQHTSFAVGTYYALLNSTSAAGNSGGTNIFNGFPTSTVFNINDGRGVNESGSGHIAYCFAEKQGYSKFGSYTGNGSTDGTFVYTGFKPAFILWKKSSASGTNWVIFDNKRDTYNATNHYLLPNLSNAEGTSDSCDLLSNGFKWRSTDGGSNGSGSTFIYMAFAENPFVTSTGVPATAR